MEFVDVSRKYGEGDNVTVALDKVSFKIFQGEFVAITGPSGSGKSTLLHLMGLLDRPSEGRIMVNGEEASKLDDTKLAKLRSKTIGFVFQQFNLLAKTPAIANVELPLIYQGIGAGERKAMAKDELEKVGLGQRLFNRPSQLSGGQQQRVAIARALVTSPSLLLADEPTGNLDSKTGLEILGLFQQLNDRGVTLVMVTHAPEIAALAKRQIHVRDGRIDG
jgi:putative ABC transport system ATP-binding protein